MGLEPRLSYSLLSSLAGVYALLLVGVIMSSKGDHKQELDLFFWFPWQLIFLVCIVTDHNPHDLHLYNVATWTQTAIRVVGCVCMTLQTLAFMIWASVLWAQQGSAAPAFISVAVFLLAAQFVIGALMSLVALMAVWMPQFAVPFMHGDDRRYSRPRESASPSPALPPVVGPPRAETELSGFDEGAW